MKLKAEDFETRYQNLTGKVVAHCQLATELVGGMPADEDGLRAFGRYHLGLDGDELEAAVRRISKEEIGERNETPVLGEVEEKRVYGVNVIRRTQFGPYLGNWMIKACIKQAASRIKVFSDIRGTKGNFSEAARVYAVGESLVEPDNPERIYLIGPDCAPAKTEFKEFMGRVNGPKGATSIIHHSECAPPGTLFSFEYRFLSSGVKEQDLADVMSMAMVCGLGSVKALERGKFRILDCEIDLGAKPEKRGEKASKATVTIQQ